jgi:hypothetical protein
MIQALWSHTHRLWIFHNNEDYKNDNRVRAHKQKALDEKITELYSSFGHNILIFWSPGIFWIIDPLTVFNLQIKIKYPWF